MAETISSYYTDITYKNAYKAHTEMDVALLAHPDYLDGTRKFLEDCKKNPTKALTALKKVKTGFLRAPKHYAVNMAIIKSIPDIKAKIEEIKLQIERDYHNTEFVRKRLIQYHRVVFGKVVPRSKFINTFIKVQNILRCFMKSI